MELNEAIGRISEIRAQIARTETFRGFHSLTVGFSGMLGVVASVIQANRIARPTEQIGDYLYLWIGAALFSLLVVGAELAYRWSVTDSPLKQRLTILAIRQFAPCLVAGAALTVVVAASAAQIAWVLPGLWAIFFSLGIFACRGLLPRALSWVGVHYLCSGTICLAVGQGARSLSPWLMVGTFVVGQFLAAGILSYTLERRHEQGQG